jgi:mxaJ protein
MSLAAAARELRVCADPDNLPFSDVQQRGFENRIASLIARDLDAELVYYWLPQGRGFTRKTLLDGHCDVIPGLPIAQPNVLTTTAYYRGTYALVHRADLAPAITGLDDPRLRTLRIGLPLLGVEAATTPPGCALARRGIFDNVVGFPVVGEGPAVERMINALAIQSIDAAIVWSPQAGYFIERQAVPMMMVPLVPGERDPGFGFEIAMGLRPDDGALRQSLNASLERLRPAIDAVLREYAVPLTRGDALAEPAR